MTGDCLRQLELIKTIVGTQNYSNILLVTTHWPRLVEDQKKQHCAVREGDLRREFWKDMIAHGATMARFDDQHSTAKAIIRRLAGKEDITLELQQELAKGGLKSTSAFSFIVNRRKKDEELLKSIEERETVDPESVHIRKEDEGFLKDDVVARVVSAIEKEEAAAQKEKRKVTVQGLIRWILSLTNIAMGAAQVGLAA
jgi:hypothetical protein